MATLSEIEKRLWSAADTLRANSKLRSADYSAPVLGLIFLRYADVRFEEAHQEITASGSSGRRTISKTDYQARGVLFLPPEARYSALLELPGGTDLGKAMNEAMRAIERENEDLKGTLPKGYNLLDNDTLSVLLKNFNDSDLRAAVSAKGEAGDVFGRIYEYFLGRFAASEGQKGGEFFTPTAIVRLIVEVIQPFKGRILDPACGSGGMFVQSARFIREHRRDPSQALSIHGQEKATETVRLCKMNLAVHGLAGDIKQGNTYYEDLHSSIKKGDDDGRFDFVMANPPFNVDKVDKEKLKGDPRFPLGMPSADNANTLWMQIFYTALNPKGRGGYVMASSAGDARGSEKELRREIIEAGGVDIIIAVGPNFFYTVALPCTLWFLDKGKRGTPREDTVLFLDARPLFRQVDRAHRDFTPAQIELLANIARLYRGEEPEFTDGSRDDVDRYFAAEPGSPRSHVYRDVPGLCCAASRESIKGQQWSLNPGRYVGLSPKAPDEFVFLERLEELSEELELLNVQAHGLEERITANTTALLQST